MAKILRRIAYVYDGDFREGHDAKVYCLGGFPSSIWDRYLAFASELIVLVRFRRGGNVDVAKYVLSSRDGVEFRSLGDSRRLADWLRQRKNVSLTIENSISGVDLVIVRLPSRSGLVAVQVAKRLGIPVAAEVVGHGYEALMNHRRLAFRLYAPLFHLQTKAAIRKCVGAIYVTSTYLQAAYPNHGIVASASNVEISLPALELVNDLVNDRIETRRSPVVGLIGSLDAGYKGIDLAIAAVSILARRGRGVHLRVLGPGDAAPYAALSRKLGVESQITFDGVLSSRDEVDSWLDALHIYIQPSRTEGLPRAMIEAQARGLLAIGTKVGGIPELLPCDQMADAYAPAIAERLEWALELNDAEYRARAVASFRRVEGFGRTKLAQVRLEFLRSVSEYVRGQAVATTSIQ